MRNFGIVFFIFLSLSVFCQEAVIRGNIYDKTTGDPIIFGSVYLKGADKGTTTNENGFFIFSGLPEGKYTIVANYLGYDSVNVNVNLRKGEIEYVRLTMESSGIELTTVDVSAARQASRTEVQISTQRVSQQEIQSLPSTGGEADIAQYLPVLPGIVFTGDQGGRLYIRGGAPVQNKILLDGMTIYNPFHSIGLFSVFETELIKNVEVQSAGFSAEYGGRVSAIVDIDTRVGNKKRFGGTIGVSPFQAKAVLEGPIIPSTEDNNSSLSFIFAGKEALIDDTDQFFYDYASDSTGLPFNYRDLYGKLSFTTNNGSKFDVFGFNFTDDVVYPDVAELSWDASGAGGNFTVIPSNSNFILSGMVAGSDYTISLDQGDNEPRESKINNFIAELMFTYYGGNNELKYGFNVNSISTDFSFTNFAGFNFEQNDNNTELNGFIKYKQELGDFILEPSLRIQFYSSINTVSLEPRFRFKYNITRDLRFKGAVGNYSQNLLSTVNDRDIVNLFVGFLIGPEETLFDPETGLRVDNRLQRAWHYVGGFEYDLGRFWRFNAEAYLKDFGQLVDINRNKIQAGDPNYVVETGEAYGFDFNAEYKNGPWDLWATYSLSYVNRFNGEQRYPTNFDRRHNINLLGTYRFGNNGSWQLSARWNFGTGFPFTLTEGFYGRYNFEEGVNEDIVQNNPEIGILYDDEINGGRLPTYHRLDLSLKKRWQFSDFSSLEAQVSITNTYNRENIFFFDRVDYERVDQLPIMPAAGIVFRF
jgi:hypothetical protein